MFNYIASMNSAKETKNEKVKFSNPVMTGNQLIIDGIQYMVFVVTHQDGGDSIIECDEM